MNEPIHLHPIGTIESSLKSLADCPLQGPEGAPDAVLRISDEYKAALKGISSGKSLMILTWLHAAKRDVLQCYPRKEIHAPVVGVFSTRSPDRPNPIGYHEVVVKEIIDETSIRVHPLEALDGTPVIDIKPII